MASKELVAKVVEYDNFAKALNQQGYSSENNQNFYALADAYYKVAKVAFVENDIEYGLKQTSKAKKVIEYMVKNAPNNHFSDIWDFEERILAYKIKSAELDLYYAILCIEARYWLDSFCLYIERHRPVRERFYLPRRDTLIKVVEKIQDLEDGKLDELFIHMPPRVGKSQIITMATAWHCARDTEQSNLYVTYKEGLGGAFLIGVQEIFVDPTYAFKDVFPDVFIAATDAKNNKIDLNRKKKYKSLSGKGLESGLNGEYDAKGLMILDDILEGIQDVLNPDTLKRKQIVFDNNVMSRKKEQCKVIYNGTIWSLHDLYMDRLDFLQNNPEASYIRWDILKIPALNENDESNFDYKYGVGFTTQYYKALRAKFQESDCTADFMAQYQQEPIERDGAVFSPDNMKFYNGILPKEGLYRVCAACDVALGGADYLSFPVAYMYEDGSVYIHDVVYNNGEKNITMPKVCDAILNNDVGSAFFEANQGGEGYKDEVEKMLKEISGKKINMRSEYAPTFKRKEQRIWDKAPTIRQWYFRDNGCREPEYRKFMTNLFSFTVNGKNKHEDAADSLSSLAYFIDGSWNSASVEAVLNPFRSGRNYTGGYGW